MEAACPPRTHPAAGFSVTTAERKGPRRLEGLDERQAKSRPSTSAEPTGTTPRPGDPAVANRLLKGITKKGPADELERVADLLPDALNVLMTRRSAACPGPDGRSLTAIVENGGGENLLVEARNAILSGDFIAQRVRYRPLNTTPGKTRWFAIRCARDLLIERAVSLALPPAATWAHPMSFAFRSGQGTSRVTSVLRENAWPYDVYVKLDIINFFDSVRHRAVLKALRRIAPDDDFLRLVGSLLRAGERNSRQGRGLGQGTVLAPVLSNLVLTYAIDDLFPREMGLDSARLSPSLTKRVDPELWRRLRPVSLGYLRYADDVLVLLAGDWTDGQAVLDLLGKALKPLGLHVRGEVGAMYEGFEFLSLRYSPQIGSQRMRVEPGTRTLNKLVLNSFAKEEAGYSRGAAMHDAVAPVYPYLVSHYAADEIFDLIRPGVKALEAQRAISAPLGSS